MNHLQPSKPYDSTGEPIRRGRWNAGRTTVRLFAATLTRVLGGDILVR